MHKDGTISTFCSSSCNAYWNEGKKRWLVADEVLSLMGMPVLAQHAAAGRVDCKPPPPFVTEAAKFKMAGNGMHVPSVGYAMLVSVLGVRAFEH